MSSQQLALIHSNHFCKNEFLFYILITVHWIYGEYDFFLEAHNQQTEFLYSSQIIKFMMKVLSLSKDSKSTNQISNHHSPLDVSVIYF